MVNIALTPAGSLAAADIPAVLCQVLNAHLAGLSPHECGTLKSLLQRVLANTGRPASPHGGPEPIPPGAAPDCSTGAVDAR